MIHDGDLAKPLLSLQRGHFGDAENSLVYYSMLNELVAEVGVQEDLMDFESRSEVEGYGEQDNIGLHVDAVEHDQVVR